MNVNRPNGRSDYQIIYVTDGYITIETKLGLKKHEKEVLLYLNPIQNSVISQIPIPCQDTAGYILQVQIQKK